LICAKNPSLDPFSFPIFHQSWCGVHSPCAQRPVLPA
jgi:hypothetical protein